MSADQFARVTLSRVAGIGPKLFRVLLHEFGTATAVLAAGPEAVGRVAGVGPRLAAALAEDRPRREAETILRHAAASSVDVLCVGDTAYPAALRPFPEAPPVLYHRGATDLHNVHRLAVVGTRDMSEAGRSQVGRLLGPLVGYAPLVVSGLAYGVDVAAHRRCLELGLPTLAVLGSGFDHVYPHAHRAVARRMVAAGGGLLSEYPPWIRPQREHFPARNRIVAMLADLTVVVESNLRGGSMITAGMAHTHGRLVGACPGRPGDPRTAGCNELIRAGRAHLIEDGEDVVQLLNWQGASRRVHQASLFGEMDPEETRIVNLLRDQRSASIDELRRSLGTPPAQLAGQLLALEIRDVVRALPGHRYQLNGVG